MNSKLLIQAGFIDKLMAGVYTMLPLGWRVVKKIEAIVREEMEAVGGQEVFMPSLSPQSLWETTGRLEKMDSLFEARGANEVSRRVNDSSYILGATHEEIATPLVGKYVFSYRDLPVAVFQIQSKFRNEPRPRSGLLRGREFLMKDLYSFHTSPEDLRDYYEKVKQAYIRIFERLGAGEDTYVAWAGGGDFTEEYSHEFQTKCPTGEDLCFYAPSANICFNEEAAPSRAPGLEEDEEEKQLREIETKGVTTVEGLAKFMEIPVYQTTKTLLYETDKGEVVAVAVRGDYDINELKLKKILSGQNIQLAGEDKVKEITGAELGFAGMLGLPEEVKMIWDDSLKGKKNMEMGANKTDYHVMNVNFGRDIPEPEEFYDIKVAQAVDYYPETGEKYETFNASEVGNIFILNTKYTESFGYYYTDNNGEQKPVYMGSYGLGPTRTMGVLAEKFSDDKGLAWPETIAPFRVHLVSLFQNKEAEKIYEQLREEGVEVLYDDREEATAGEKFADADLIGCPFRVVVSRKTLDQNGVEWKKRSEEESEIVSVEEVMERLKN